MQFYNIEDRKEEKTFRQAVLQSSGRKRGLFFPVSIPQLSETRMNKLDSLSLPELAAEVLIDYLDEDFTKEQIMQMCKAVFNFQIPLVKIEESLYSLELFHGPSLAFKDIGARFLAEVLKKFALEEDKKITVLVATSGDTGSAVARGFYNIEGIDVVLLYPSGKVSPLQEKTLTTMNGNIHALEVDGTFDDCQRLVKTAFADDHLTGKLRLTSANSINIGRLLPQIIYYFWAWTQLSTEEKQELIISVPSGNYGNLSAGIMAKSMGLPVQYFIAASNINKVVPDYLKTGVYKPRSAVQTLSNAMDVGNPSNFARIKEIFDGDFSSLTQTVKSHVVTDEQVRSTIKEIYSSNKYLLDPHGTVAYKGLKVYLKNGETGIFLETGHPGKFNQTLEEILGEKIELPEYLKQAQKNEKHSHKISAQYVDFKDWLLEKDS
ncbi:MAG: threonine synthase [Bacteroidales bacterium]